MIRFKICCIQSIEEAKLAIDMGAYAIGLVSEMPSGPGVISEDRIAEISSLAPAKIKSVLLTSKTSSDDIIRQHNLCCTRAIQLVDAIPPMNLKMIRKQLIDTEFIQVIHVTGLDSIQKAKQVSPLVDAVLLDSGNPDASIKELGGTGRVHNWEISKQIVDAIDIPVYLAGGLNGQNISTAINTVKPFAVDVCSGVRTNGKLDPEKLQAFVNNINAHNFLD